jgi:hypothetical protein
MAAFRFRSRRTRRLWVTGLTLTALALFAVVFVAASSADNASGCDFAASGTTQSCSGPLSGSTFAGGDGNLKASPTTFGSTDWENVAGLNAGFDLPSGTGDNAFGGGTKEDDPAVTVVSGSIPPNKSDLTRFYEASEFANNSNFLYLAWERSNVLGSANMDFEINQKTQPDLTTAGSNTLNRTAGDLLVTFDFTNGGGTPTLGLLFWVTSGSTSQCFSSNSLPCWGNHVTLNGTNSIGAVNNLDAVTDPLFPNSPNYINPVPALQFGETAINLTAAGVFPPGTCKAFGSAFLKSRASASFPAEVKDFIAPIPVNINNCGSIKIIKHTDPRGKDKTFSYTSNLPAEAPGTVNGVPQGGVACPGNSSAGVQSDGSFCLNDSGNSTSDNAANTVYNNALQAATYHVTEGADPSGFTFESLTCTGGTTSTVGKTATITLAPGDAVTCTYVNQLNTATMSTTPSNTSNPVVPGSAVHDTATVTGNPSTAPTPSGTVTFFLCSFPVNSTSTCDGTTNVGENIGTGTLSGSGATATATSPDRNTSSSPLAAGHYCFRAEWPGDSNYILPQALSFDGSSECFDVTTVNSTTLTIPSLSTIALADINGGAKVTDNAVVSPVVDAGQVTGTVNFFICGPIATGTCTSGGTAVGTNVMCSPAGSHTCQATSDPVGSSIITTVGRYCFRAEYGGDSRYNPSSDSGTLESECFTVTDTSSVTTTQDWLPNDTAEVKSAGGTALSGSVTFTLYDNGTCDGNVKYTENVDVTTGTGTASDETVHTHNTATSSPNFIVTAANNTGAYSWKVTFPGFDSVAGSSSNCESTTGPIVINDNH